MFNFFRKSQSEEKKLQQAYEGKLHEAMTAQRQGDIRRYSELSEQAAKLYAALQAHKERTSK